MVVKEQATSYCTDIKCKEAILGDYEPVDEIVWINNSRAVRTIKNGDIVSSLARPKVDLEGEMESSSTADLTKREDTFEREKQDVAYINMAKAGTYSFSKKILSQEYPASMGYEYNVRAGDNVYLKALLKPKSFEYTNGEYYFYSVLKMDMKYAPHYGKFLIMPKLKRIDSDTFECSNINQVTQECITETIRLNGEVKPNFFATDTI